MVLVKRDRVLKGFARRGTDLLSFGAKAQKGDFFSFFDWPEQAQA